MLSQLRLERAGHAARYLTANGQNVIFVGLIDREAGGLADALEVIGHRRQQRFVDGVRVAEQFDVVDHDLGRRHRLRIGAQVGVESRVVGFKRDPCGRRQRILAL